ncbi:MAG: hypothetical protein Q7S17_11635 [Xanthobacteraceae bacterium]|nr:hypothetical protein [Xanthobacteraceae bacterium]
MRRCPCRVIAIFALILFAASLADGNVLAAQSVSESGTKSDARKSTQSRKKDSKKKDAKKGKKKDAAAKDLRVWTLGRDSAGPSLYFGLPNSDEPVISFSCQIEAGLVRVVSFIGSRGVRPGDGARLRLSNGTTRMEIAGTAFATETKKSVDIGGATRIDTKLFALFRTGDTLLVEVPGKKIGLPVKTLGTKVDAFEKSCTARR